MKKLKKGDTVLVTAGKDKGKTGEIIRVMPKKAAVVVKGVNLYKRHQKAREGVEGGVVSRERPLSVAKVALSIAGKAVRIGLKRDKDGVIRLNKKTGKAL